MKKVFLCAVLASFAASVTAADSLEIESAGATTVVVAGSCSTMYSNSNFNGWDISLAFGASNSPGLSPFGIDLAALVSCDGGALCTANPLKIFYSDTNFNVPVAAGDFQNAYSATFGGSGSGTTNELAWASSTNSLFALGGANKIGSGVGPFSGTNAGTAVGGPAETAPYSLTVEDTFTDTTGSVSFSTDTNVTATPEPSSLVLLGAGLLMLPMALKWHLRKVRE